MPEAVIVRDTVWDSDMVVVKEGVIVEVLEDVGAIEGEADNVLDTVGLGVFVTDEVDEGLREDVGDDVMEEDVVGVTEVVGLAVIETLTETEIDLLGVRETERELLGDRDVEEERVGVGDKEGGIPIVPTKL
jgi:hypothetical protein